MSELEQQEPQQPPQDAEQQTKAPELAVPAGGIPLIYVNWMRTIGSPADLAIDVGYQFANEQPQPGAHLVLTWEHARLLRDTLTELIEGMEREFGGEVRDLKQHIRMGPPKTSPVPSQATNPDED